MSEPFEALGRARRVLQDGLALLDRVMQDQDDSADALVAICAALDSLEDPTALRDEAKPADLERFDDELEDLVRLNAVLVSAVGGERDRLVSTLAKVRQSRRDLGHLGTGDQSGVRCDVAG